MKLTQNCFYVFLICCLVLISDVSFAFDTDLSATENSSVGDGQLVSQTKKRRLKKRKVIRKKQVRKSATPAKESIKGVIGFVMGGGDLALMVGGEYQPPLSKLFGSAPKWIFLSAGGSFWTVSGMNVISIDVGADAFFSLKPDIRLYGGGRFSYSRVSLSSSGVSASTSALYLMPLGGADYHISPNAGYIGAEFRLPLTSKIDGTYLLATYRIEF